jgi:hypothetical protein
MTRTGSMGVTLVLSLLALPALAQDDDAERYTYATYFHCNVGKEDRADEIMERDAPILDGLVKDGKILAWGWMSHHTGGDWRRIRYHQAASPEAAMEALETMSAAIAEAHGEDDPANAEMAEACPRHDDYLWQAEAGMSGKERGKVGFSVYHFCDINREDRADEIVAEHFAPILDKMVEDGKIATWGWQSHVIGGRARRLQTMTAVDMGALLSARQEAIATIYEEDDEAGTEFSEICGPHVDYVWNIVHEAQ